MVPHPILKVMEAIHFRQRLRPIRYAFMVNQGDIEAALSAVSLNTALWGGLYNPIIPVIPEAEPLLAEFDPDEILDLTGGRLDRPLLDRYPLRVVTPEHLVDRDRNGRRRLGFGFDVLPILREIHEKEVRHSTDPTRAALVHTDAGDGWPEYVSFAFGSFSRLPEVDIDFSDIFRRALRARDVAFDPGHPDESAEIFSPIIATGHGLRVFTPPASYSTHIIYVGDHRNIVDLVAFWNIRATGRTVLFVPVEGYERHAALIRTVAEDGRYPINPHLENEPDLQKAPSVEEGTFGQVCDWIGTLGVGRISRRNTRPRFRRETEHYVGDIHACELEAKSGEEISIFQEERMTPVKLISPDQLDEERTFIGDYEWALDLTLSGAFHDNDHTFTFPKEATVERLIPPAFIGGKGAARLGRHGVVTLHHSPRDILYPHPVDTQAVFAAVFEQAGLEMEPS